MLRRKFYRMADPVRPARSVAPTVPTLWEKTKETFANWIDPHRQDDSRSNYSNQGTRTPGARPTGGSAPGKVPSDKEVAGAKRAAGKEVNRRIKENQKQITALEAKGAEATEAEKANLDQLKKSQSQLESISAGMKDYPIGVLNEKLKEAGIEVSSVKAAATSGDKVEAEVAAMKAQTKLNESQADALTNPDSPENKSKIAQAESAKIQAETGKLNAETQKKQGIATAVNGSVTAGTQVAGLVLTSIKDEKARKSAEKMKNLEIKSAEKQKKDELRRQGIMQAAQLNLQIQQAADAKYGTKNRAVDSPGSTLSKGGSSGTNEVVTGVGVAREKYSQRNSAGTYTDPSQAEREREVAEARSKQEQLNQQVRSSRPERPA